MVRESTRVATRKLMRAGKLALMRPVMTSTLGRCVANTKCMPTARAICARRVTDSSTLRPSIIMRSANSSIRIRMCGSDFNSSAGASSSNRLRGCCSSLRSFLLNCSIFRTPCSASTRSRRSISSTAFRSTLVAFLGSVITGVSRCGTPS